MDASLPNAKSARSPNERRKLRRVIAEHGLCGLANDTKWNEFITGMRAHEQWRPSYRCKCIDSPPSSWDAEWFYDLPFPLISVEWLDVSFLERTHRGVPNAPVIADHSPWIKELIGQVGMDYQKGNTMIRVFGYSSRNLELFDR